MPYEHATAQEDYTDYASGRVLYSLPGLPALPVRLVSEMFQRCLAAREAERLVSPVTLYDPCCGGAYHLTTLAYLHWEALSEIIASDIEPDAVDLAQRNLALLTPAGLGHRTEEISEMLESYGKASHAAALESAQRLRSRLELGLRRHSIATRAFQADATRAEQMVAGLQGTVPDIILTDVPYGQASDWRLSTEDAQPALWQMLEALRPITAPHTLVAIASDKGQRAVHEAFRRVERFNLGKRRIEILRLA